MRFPRSFAPALALAFLILPATPLGGMAMVPTVGGDAVASSREDDAVKEVITPCGPGNYGSEVEWKLGAGAGASYCASPPRPYDGPPKMCEVVGADNPGLTTTCKATVCHEVCLWIDVGGYGVRQCVSFCTDH